MATHSAARRTVVKVVKIALAIGILSYLVFQAHGAISRLRDQTIQWPLVAVGMACTFIAVTLNFVRWHLLIRALGIGVRLTDTLKLGALGFAMNFVSPGAIGGDFFRAAFLAHGQPGRRTEAVATVVADRIVGLLTMLLLACCGILASGLLDAPSAPLRLLCRSILIAAAVSWTVFGLLLFVPALTKQRWSSRLGPHSRVGNTIARLLGAVQAYRSQKRILLAVFGLSTVMALFFVSSFYWVARGLPIREPPWREHLVIVPVAALVGAIPITPSGLGTTELAVEELYRAMPGDESKGKGNGTLVALTRRATELIVALVGLVYYLLHRREVEAVYAEAEEAAEAG